METARTRAGEEAEEDRDDDEACDAAQTDRTKHERHAHERRERDHVRHAEQLCKHAARQPADEAAAVEDYELRAVRYERSGRCARGNDGAGEGRRTA